MRRLTRSMSVIDAISRVANHVRPCVNGLKTRTSMFGCAAYHAIRESSPLV